MSDATPGGTWGIMGSSYISSTGVYTAYYPYNGSVTYSVANSFGCITRAQKFVQPVAGPYKGVIVGDSNICLKGGGVSLVNNIAPGGVWHSSDPAVASVGLNSGIVTPVSAGTARISYVLTTTTGCMDSATRNAHVISIDTTVTVNGFTLTSNQGGNVFYNWSDCRTHALVFRGSGPGYRTFTAPGSGIYSVEIVSNANYCSDSSACITVGTPEGTSHISNDLSLEMFPNPATSTVTLRINAALSGMIMQLKDVTGRTLRQERIIAQRTSINVSGLPAGVYLIEISNSTARAVQRISIVR